MDIVSRLKLFLDHLGIPVTQFADNCGIPRPTLSQLLNGRNKTVRDEIIAKIHEAYPQLSIMWLMFGEGDMVSGEDAPIQAVADNSAITNNREDAENSFFTTGTSTDGENQNLSDFNNDGMNNSNDMSLPLDFMLDSESMHDNGTSIRAELDTDANKRPDLTGPLETSSLHSAERIEAKGGDRTITFHQDDMTSHPGASTTPPSTDKRVVSIIVYYSDNSYQSFIPDPQSHFPMPR